MPSLIIYRDSSGADTLRTYSVFLDGHKIAEVRDGERLTFPIADGEHTVQASIAWAKCKVVKFVVSDRDVIFNVEKQHVRH